MSKAQSKALHFDVSSGLKSVLGSELITADDVAIFELVKNSFDAAATHVDLFFSDERIVIADNGNGMTLNDIQKKWLFVGYSSKREQNREDDYRDAIAARRHYAGSKGVGRLSSDRLGANLKLQSRAKSERTGPVQQINVDWSLFDQDHLQHFDRIPVTHSQSNAGFDLPAGLRKLKHGTVITIESLRGGWSREAILRLKSSLAKLINPFGVETDGFSIRIIAPNEKEGDNHLIEASSNKGEEPVSTELVNGEVGNFIFTTLREKTTFIVVTMSSCGRFIESSLTDRGELIYRIREPNAYPELKGSKFKCDLYFLNYSAKQTFTKRMGVPSVQFGSAFLFRNGFRVFPIGEEGDDWFRMDRRKAQGYARFLGTRDVIGRIEIEGEDADFKEASSRDKGLLDSPAVVQLKKCFMDQCLKRLERYVVPVTFPDSEDSKTGDTSRLSTDPGKARIAAAVAKLVDDKDVELIAYSRRLISILHERSEEFESSIVSLKAIAAKVKDKNLFQKVEEAERRFEKLRRSEEAARAQVDLERNEKERAQARAAKAEASIKTIQEELAEEKQLVLFHTSSAARDKEQLEKFLHQIIIYSVDLRQQIENFLVSVSGKKMVAVDEVVSVLESLTMLNSKTLGVSRFATKANFRLESDEITTDLGRYIQQYLERIARDELVNMRLRVECTGKGFEQSFKPIEVTVIIDNLIQNSKKARAKEMVFMISRPHKGATYVDVCDDGDGFSGKITNVNRIFEKGFTTTDGSGLGLYHVRQVLGEMNGTIEAIRNGKKGAQFHIRIAK